MHASVAMQGLAHPGPLPFPFIFLFFFFLSARVDTPLGRPISLTARPVSFTKRGPAPSRPVFRLKICLKFSVFVSKNQ
jgi:hypothetical protein